MPPDKTVGRKLNLIHFNVNRHDERHDFLTTWEVPRGSSPWKVSPLCMFQGLYLQQPCRKQPGKARVMQHDQDEPVFLDKQRG
ncbi:uncharacterized protein N7473_011898 [Penicillium subrubescens]|jgi:hypothetical protein|nr:uncharacterized protein N7473_011898 [Penicillium subrubescens]KAJ5880845.1 hypothetical protein N7473_011898 [Penicillium subrubescens]